MPLDAYTHQSIVRAAQEHGIDPATALAIAERESSFNVHGGSGTPLSSARGLFQLLRSERAQYGGDSSDPYEQSSAWANYIQPHKQHMAKVLGRDPTGPELYFSHLIGPGRAARIAAGHIHPDTPIQEVMTPRELAANPFMARAGTAGNLFGSVTRDIARREAKYGGTPPPQGDGTISSPQGTAQGQAQPFNFAQYGELVDSGQSPGESRPSPGQTGQSDGNEPKMNPGPAPTSASSYSQYGELVPT